MTVSTAPPDPAPLPIHFDQVGLVPAVIQDSASGDVLMIGFMNEAALRETRTTGRVHFWSRSRNKLWRKGETSGHEQILEAIHVNCEQSSLLVTVRQIGAVCHEGYPTCFYRRLEDDNSLAVVIEREFDPAVVYRSGPEGTFADATRRLFGAYAYLRDNDLTDVSSTSARLRASDDTASHRIVEELVELAGALDGSHSHDSPQSDVLLESSQVIYWVTLAALRGRLEWHDLRPDRALLSAAEGMEPSLVANLIRGQAVEWQHEEVVASDRVHRFRVALTLVGQACSAADVSPLAVVESDLAALRDRPYLAGFFAMDSAGATDR